MNRVEYNDSVNSYNRRHSYVEPYKRNQRNRQSHCSDIINKEYSSASKLQNVFKTDNLKNEELTVGNLVAKLKDKDFINGKIASMAEWFEVDDKALRTEGPKKKMPTKWVVIISVVAMSLMLVVSGAVISSNALMELYSSQNELAELQTKQAELDHELELKNDLRYIEKVAREELGMINREHGTVQYINSELNNKVEVYEKNTVYSKISSLLDSLSFIGK